MNALLREIRLRVAAPALFGDEIGAILRAHFALFSQKPRARFVGVEHYMTELPEVVRPIAEKLVFLGVL